MENNDADEPLSAAREVAAQARVASTMPVGDELERLRAELAAAKTRLAATAGAIPQLKLLIESTNSAVAARQEEAGKKRAAAAELRLRVDRGRAALRLLHAEVAAARDAKDSLERRALVRRQAARAMHLAERAVAAEAHALAWAAEQAARVGGGDGDGDAHHDVVTLPARRLEELREAVEAEEREAKARVAEAQARRRAAKARRAAAVARLNAARAKKREAADELRRRMDCGDEGHGKRARRSRFTVKKLRSFLCNVGKA